MTSVLVAHASRHGSTRAVAESIAATLRDRGLSVDVRPAADVDAITGHDAVVLGGALYTGRWHADARRFLERHTDALTGKALAVFAMGPRTLEPADVESSRAQLDRALARFPALAPSAVAIFGGVVDPSQLRFPLSRMPASDARDWAAIAAWAREIAASLVPATAQRP